MLHTGFSYCPTCGSPLFAYGYDATHDVMWASCANHCNNMAYYQVSARIILGTELFPRICRMLFPGNSVYKNVCWKCKAEITAMAWSPRDPIPTLGYVCHRPGCGETLRGLLIAKGIIRLPYYNNFHLLAV